MYFIKVNANNEVIEKLVDNREPQGYIKIEKAIFQKINLPSKIKYDNGEIIVENIITPIDENIEKKKARITQLKNNLAKTDYQAIKYAEGQLTEDEYAPIKNQRQLWRDEINKLENIAEEV